MGQGATDQYRSNDATVPFSRSAYSCCRVQPGGNFCPYAGKRSGQSRLHRIGWLFMVRADEAVRASMGAGSVEGLREYRRGVPIILRRVAQTGPRRSAAHRGPWFISYVGFHPFCGSARAARSTRWAPYILIVTGAIGLLIKHPDAKPSTTGRVVDDVGRTGWLTPCWFVRADSCSARKTPVRRKLDFGHRFISWL